jgi:hypothetical protein
MGLKSTSFKRAGSAREISFTVKFPDFCTARPFGYLNTPLLEILARQHQLNRILFPLKSH